MLPLPLLMQDAKLGQKGFQTLQQVISSPGRARAAATTSAQSLNDPIIS
jgi:hypothetical protein